MSEIPVGIIHTYYKRKPRCVNTSAFLSIPDLAYVHHEVLSQLTDVGQTPQCLTFDNDVIISHNTKMYETINSIDEAPRQIFEFDRVMGKSKNDEVFGTVLYSNIIACFLVYLDNNTIMPLYEFRKKFIVTIVELKDKTVSEHLLEKIDPSKSRGFITVVNFSPTVITPIHHEDFLKFLKGKRHKGIYKESTGVVVGKMDKKQIFAYDEIVYYDKPERIVVYDNEFGMYYTVPKQDLSSKDKIPLVMSLDGIKYIHYRWSPKKT